MAHPTVAEYRTAIRDLLRKPKLVRRLVTKHTSRGRAYEGYVFALLHASAEDAGLKPTLVDRAGARNITDVCLRTSNGYLASAHRNYTHIEATRDSGGAWEIHLSITYQGASKADHEIDITALSAKVCDDERSHRMRAVPGDKIVAAFECKCYSKEPGISLARQFVGVLSDCGNTKQATFVTNEKCGGTIGQFLDGNPSYGGRRRPTLLAEVTYPGGEAEFRRSVSNTMKTW